MPGSSTSAVYRAAPVTFSSASARVARRPTTWRFASSPHGAGSRDGSSTILVSSRPSISTLVVTKRLGITRLRGGEHGAHDLGVRPAATEVAAHAALNVRFGR